MKVRLEATPEELREKGGELVKALSEALADVAPETAQLLSKALPPKEPELKYSVLRDIQRITKDEYARTLKAMNTSIGKVLSEAPVAKSELSGLVFVNDPTDLDKGWLCGVCGAISPGDRCEHVKEAQDNLAKALYIGPRGGKWADPALTIPWDEKKHGRQIGLALRPQAVKAEDPEILDVVANDPALTDEQRKKPKSKALKQAEATIDKGITFEDFDLPVGARIDTAWEMPETDPDKPWEHPDYGEGKGAAPWHKEDWTPDFHKYDVILINSSAGKDSQAMLTRIVEEADRQGYPREKLVVAHADLGRVEWEGTATLAQEQAEHYGLRFEMVQRKQNDLVEQIEERHGDLVQREKDVATMAQAGITNWGHLLDTSAEDLLEILGEGKGTSKWPGEHRANVFHKAVQRKLTKMIKQHAKRTEALERKVEKLDAKVESAKSDPAKQKALAKVRVAMRELSELQTVGEPNSWPIDFGKTIPWPSMDARFCTSDHKRAEIKKLITKMTKVFREEQGDKKKKLKVLNSLGIRAQESPGRLKQDNFQREEDLTVRTVDRWYPIHRWEEGKVWDTIAESGVPFHKAYDLGMRRLSCVFCVFATREDLMVAAWHNPELFKTYLDLEEKFGHSFSPNVSLAEIAGEIRQKRDDGYHLNQLAEWVKKALAAIDPSAALIKAMLIETNVTQAHLIVMLLEAAFVRLRKGSEKIEAATLEWKETGVCVHLDTAVNSHHVGYLEYPDAYNASLAVAAFAQKRGLRFEEHNPPEPLTAEQLSGSEEVDGEVQKSKTQDQGEKEETTSNALPDESGDSEERDRSGQGLAPNDDPDEIGKALYIGPRGGKWADPQHTIPWKVEKHGRQMGMQFEPPEQREQSPADITFGTSMAEAEEIIRTQPIEHFLYYSKGGFVRKVEGKRRYVQIDPVLAGVIEADPMAICSHNHPSKGDVCFSPQDILMALSLNVAEARVVTENKNYRLTRPKRPEGWGTFFESTIKAKLRQTRNEAVIRISREHIALMREKGIELTDGDDVPDEWKEDFNIKSSQYFVELFNKKFKKYGWKIVVEDLRVDTQSNLFLSEGWSEVDLEAGQICWERLEKAQAHKYIRRVPYTDAKGHKRYRYYYRESAVARAATAGEDVVLDGERVRVLKVHDNGDITLAVGTPGSKVQVAERVSAAKWAERLAGHFGPKFYEAAEKRARQAINAVLKHVPKKLLGDLKGETDAERMADLKTRVPEVYEKLQASFQRAGINPFQAKQILGDSLRREGWTPEARATVIGTVLTPEGAKLARRHREVSDAAENLAGGAEVGIEHAQAAVSLAQSNIAQVAKRAESELVKLNKLLEATRDAPDDVGKKAALLAESIAAKAVAQLNALATAFPGLVDRAIPVARDTMLQVPAAAPNPPKREGAEAAVFIAGEGGRPKALKAKYKLVEAGEVKPSHDPMSFRRNEAYPEGIQERAYHRDKDEQAKVIRNAGRMAPAFVVNTNPDAVNGPPLVTEDGVVLGGNSRTMSMQRIYDDPTLEDKAAELREYLRDHAHEVGLNPDDVDAMEKPVLVRVVVVEDKSKKNMQILVRAMNESFTQAMDPRTMQVAMGRRLSERALNILAETMNDDETLNEFLGTVRARPFVQSLNQAGIIDERNANQYMRGQKLNSDGKIMVARILAGRVLDDADLLSNTKPSIVESIAKSVPYMIQAAGAGEGYDLTETIRVALDAYNQLQDKVESKAIPFKLDKKVTDKELESIMGSYLADMFGNSHPVLNDPQAQAVLEVLIRRSGSVQMPAVFREYARMAQQNPETQAGLLGESRSPSEVFRLSVRAAVDKEAKAEAEKAAKEVEKKVKKQSGLFAASMPEGDLMKAKDTEPLLNDFTKLVHDKDAKGYERVRTELKTKGYTDADFEPGGGFYGWSTNQLIDFTRGK